MGDELIDNFGTFSAGLLGPMKTSQVILSGGNYSLSSLSTVPYASLIGKDNREKIFSWGELVYIPKGSAVRIKNASFHEGDVIINGGRDFSTLPQRVTVPVKLERVPLDDTFTIVTPETPLDTRRARRAFIAVNFVTDNISVNALITAGRIGPSKGGHSHFSDPQTLTPGIIAAGTGYDNAPQVLAASTAFGVFPLGFRADTVAPTIPHALLDFATFAFLLTTDLLAQMENAYYILEY